MNTRALHCTSEQLNLLLDAGLAPAEEKDIRDHLSICSQCSRAFESLSRVDSALRDLPLITTGVGFTRSVMDRILAGPKSSFAFRVLERMSYVFGLMIVLGIMIAAFVLSGAFDQAEIEQTQGVASEVMGKAADTVANSIGVFTAWLVRYLPFAFGKGSMGVAFFAVAIVMMLAAVDRFVGRKILQK